MKYQYEKELEGEELVIYKFDQNGKLIEYVKIFMDPEFPGWLQIDTYNHEGWYVESSHSKLSDFGVESFEELIELPVEKLAEMIWGDE